MKFVRNAVEEVLRRSFNTEKEAETITSTLMEHLYDGHKKFVDDLFERRKAEMLKEIDADSNPETLAETFKKYESEVDKLKEKFGYAIQQKPKESNGVFIIDENGFSRWLEQPADSPAQQVNKQENKSEKLDFSSEVDKLLTSLTYNNSKTRLLFDTVNVNFKKH